ncbi:MAG: molybdopterin-guanine dinucleotide biosynthesis protein B [Candidatus Thermoplasmatota archaeon]|nr:molybdopterin-guanine dinucleotide biosynthesis protein B [Candidatus Thermoplasmatota archaeon]
MSPPAVFGIYGESDSGKTTLAVQLIRELVRDGYRIATVKQTNKSISIDTKNKDTWRHQHAGASLVVFSSRSETDFLLHEQMDSAGIIRRITELKDVDVVIIEGADDPAILKIQVGAGRRRSNTIAKYDGNIPEILTRIKKEIQKTVAPHLRITVNGKAIPLTEFPEQFITNTIRAMLGSLKGVQDIRDVRIELKQ